MKSSYQNPIDYGDVIQSITYVQRPRYIVEIGILEGYSLQKLIQGSDPTTKIEAYDIFDEFNGNSANFESLQSTFESYPNVTINYGDFYKLHETLDNIDLLHVDIANNRDVYEFVNKYYVPKLSNRGIVILEGGSETRDQVSWMKQYGKPPMNPYVKQKKLKVIGDMPSLTLIHKPT
jgi:hypothetical protein